MSLVKKEVVRSFGDSSVRIVEKEGTFFFHLKDLCDAIGIKNSRNVAAKLKKDHGKAGVQTMDARNSRDELRPTNFVPEKIAYMYVIPRSNKETARKFSYWAGEAIVQIRKTGSYVENSKNEQLLIEDKKLDLAIVKLAREMFPDDARMMAITQEKLASMMLGNNSPMLEGPRLLTVSEIMEPTYSIKLIRKKRVVIGKYVVQQYRNKYKKNPEKTQKLCNGHTVRVNCYKKHEEVKAWVAEYLSL